MKAPLAKFSDFTVDLQHLCLNHLFLFLLGHYEQIMSKIQKNAQAEGITGLLLIYPEYIVHVIEVN